MKILDEDHNLEVDSARGGGTPWGLVFAMHGSHQAVVWSRMPSNQLLGHETSHLRTRSVSRIRRFRLVDGRRLA